MVKSQTLQVVVWLARARRLQAIAFLTTLSLVLLTLSLIVHLPQVNDFDRRVTHGIQGVRSDLITTVAVGLTYLGNTVTLIALAVIAAILLFRKGRPTAAGFAILMLIGLPINEVMKQLVGRPRPEKGVVEVILPAVGLSFPSGHAMASTMVFGFFAVMAWLMITPVRPRIILTLLFSTLVVGIGLSRIYLGVHWFSDVLGGFTAGLILLTLVVIWYRRIGRESVADAT